MILCNKKLQNSALKMIFVFSIFIFCYGILIFKLHIIELSSLKFYRLIYFKPYKKYSNYIVNSLTPNAMGYYAN